MEFREMIEAAARTAGNQKALADRLEETESHLSSAKAGRRGLTDEKCAKIAEMIGVRFGDVIAARNYALAREQGAKDFWRPFVERIKEAAAFAGVIVLAALLGLSAPNDASAHDSNKVTRTAQSRTRRARAGRRDHVIHIMRHLIRRTMEWIMRKAGPVHSSFAT